MAHVTRRVGGGAQYQSIAVDEWTRLTTVHWLIQTIEDVAPDDEWLAASERETLAFTACTKT